MTSSEWRELIGKEEVLTSSQLQGRLVNRGMREVAARKAIQRGAEKNLIWHSTELKLQRNERLVALPEVTGTSAFFEQASALVQERRPGLARCLSTLKKAALLTKHGARLLLATPSQRSGGAHYPDTESEIRALTDLGIQRRYRGTAYECLLSHHSSMGSETLQKLVANELRRHRKETLIGRIIVDQFRRQNLLSWNGARVPEPTSAVYGVEFNDQLFTATGFSYLAPVVRREQGQSPKPSPVLIDVYAGQCLHTHVLSFDERISRVNRGKNTMPILAVIAGRKFEEQAWNEAKNLGMLTINTQDEFGSTALDAMGEVDSILSDLQSAAESPEDSPLSSFTDSLEALKANPIVVDLCSIGFEALAALILHAQGFEQVTLGRNLPFKNTTRDVDASGERAEEPTIVECKALHHKKTVNPSEIRKFYTETVPAFLDDWSKTHGHPPQQCHAEFWTTGRFDREAREALGEIKLKSYVKAEVLTTKEIIRHRLTRRLRDRVSTLLRTIGQVGAPQEQ